MHIVIVVLLLSLGTWMPVSIAIAEPANSCIECHKDLPAGTNAGHKFSDYKGSVHDRNGVHCEACHGGDPVLADKTAAHKGVYRSGDPMSPVYFRNLPQTCGKCHGEELVNFSRSRHYSELKTSGRGPSCVTCHGSMGTFILTSDQITEFCTVCHNNKKGILTNAPQEVKNVLSMMELADRVVSWSEESVKEARRVKKSNPESEKQLTLAKSYMKQARLSWHTFRMEDVTANIKDAYTAAKKAREDIR